MERGGVYGLGLVERGGVYGLGLAERGGVLLCGGDVANCDQNSKLYGTRL